MHCGYPERHDRIEMQQSPQFNRSKPLHIPQSRNDISQHLLFALHCTNQKKDTTKIVIKIRWQLIKQNLNPREN